MLTQGAELDVTAAAGEALLTWPASRDAVGAAEVLLDREATIHAPADDGRQARGMSFHRRRPSPNFTLPGPARRPRADPFAQYAVVLQTGRRCVRAGRPATPDGVPAAQPGQLLLPFPSMGIAIQTLSFPGTLVQRGFWLYVWRVTPPNGPELLYVGRTGDSSSPNATAPYTRMGQHLGYRENQNALRAHLERRGVTPEDCISFVLAAFGPIYPEIEKTSSPQQETRMQRHIPLRDNTAVMEQRLCDELKAILLL